MAAKSANGTARVHPEIKRQAEEIWERIFCRRLLPIESALSRRIYCESSAFTVKTEQSASASPLAGQPALMHINPHAHTAFMVCGAILSHGDLS